MIRYIQFAAPEFWPLRYAIDALIVDRLEIGRKIWDAPKDTQERAQLLAEYRSIQQRIVELAAPVFVPIREPKQTEQPATITQPIQQRLF